jgi:molybdopterin/thiamine biosynthesis adenylyltransferase/nitroreductase
VIVTPPASLDEVWQPLILDAASAETGDKLDELISDGRVQFVHDTLEDQARDLVRTRRCVPDLSEREFRRDLERLTGGHGLEAYGNWVHYPWSGRLVRLLPQEAFRELKFDRNRNKISVEEQHRLRRATVAIVGLSVGNAAAITMTMEGGYGHLKLADFDTLELSNLNRLRAGIHEIGLPKTVLAARQIVELDPYASLSLFPAGVTRDNVDELLTGEPRVDVLVDECDSLEIKLLLRERARVHGIPVVMETSDRGLIDIERFDQEPTRPAFHGLWGKASAHSVAGLAREEQLSLVLALVDADRISARAAASLLEIDTTLTTWPQLASEVTLGGSTIATAVRGIVLGSRVGSGRAYVDTADALARATDPLPQRPARGSTVTPERAPEPPVPDAVRFILDRAILAPSGGNCQPWRFVLDGDAVEVHLDRSRSRGLLNASSHASYLALGAAIENAAIAGASLGLAAHVDVLPDALDPTKAAVVRFEASREQLLNGAARLLPAVERRTTNRQLGLPTPPDASECTQLTTAAAACGAHLELLTERPALDEASTLVGTGDRIRFVSPDLHAELAAELRWSEQEAGTTGDGIDVATLGLRPADRAVLRLLVRPDTAAALRETRTGLSLARLARRAFDGAGAVGLLRASGASPAAWLEAGRALERVWLVADDLGLAFQPMTSVLYLLELLELPQSAALSAYDRDALRAVASKLCGLFTAHADYPPALLFRLAKGAPPPARRSLRRPLGDVVSVSSHDSSVPR